MMSQKIFSLMVCGCLCITLTAQTFRIDSLEQALASGRGTRVEKVEMLAELSLEYLTVDTGKCRLYALEAIQLARNTGSAEGTAYNALGRYYQKADLPHSAHVNYRRAEKLFIEHGDDEGLFKIYINLMILFCDIEDKHNTEYYADMVQKMAAKRGDVSREINALFYLGWAHFESDDSQEALDFYQDLYRKSIPLNNAITFVIAVKCGQICLRMNAPREAIQYLHRARSFFEEGGFIIMLETYGYLAEAYAMIQQKDSAEYYMKKAWDSHMVNDDTRLILFRSQSILYSQKGDYRKALESYKLFHHLSDSLAKVGKTTEIARMKNWYELDQKDHEYQLLQQERQKQKRLINTLVLALILIVALFLLSAFFYRKTAEKNLELKKLHTVKDKLFSVVAHDLRSPMGALTSMLKLANRNMLDAETQAQLLRDISVRVDDTYGLLDNLLRWSKSQMQGMVPAPVYFDVQKGSQTVTDSLQSIAASKQITLENQIVNQQVYADRDMFAVLVRNLTMNAIKYTSAKGKITLDSELSDNMLVISVKDTGMGIPQEVQDKLFNLSETRSRRGTNNESGTGLGLVLCADFVKANGGRIWFSSKQGEGSTFFFSIPLKEQHP